MDRIKENLIKYQAPLLVVIGVLFYFGGTQLQLIAAAAKPPEQSAWGPPIKSLAEIILIGGIFSVITKSFHFRNVIKEELTDVIFGGEDNESPLRNVIKEGLTDVIFGRKHIESLQDEEAKRMWRELSGVIYTRKFPEISGEIESTVLDKYFSNTEFYYSNMRSNIEIVSIDPKNGIFKLIEKSFFTIKSAKPEQEVKYSFWARNKIPEGYDEPVTIEKLTIEGEDYLNKNDGETVITREVDEENNTFKIAFRTLICDKMEYVVEKEIHRVFNIREDNDKNYTSTRFIKDFTVHVTFPPELEVLFTPIGTADQFKNKVSNQTVMEYHYRGLLMVNQGYRLKYDLKTA